MGHDNTSKSAVAFCPWEGGWGVLLHYRAATHLSAVPCSCDDDDVIGGVTQSAAGKSGVTTKLSSNRDLGKL